MQAADEVVVAIRTQVAGVRESLQSVRSMVNNMRDIASVEIAANLATIDTATLQNSVQEVRSSISRVSDTARNVFSQVQERASQGKENLLERGTNIVEQIRSRAGELNISNIADIRERVSSIKERIPSEILNRAGDSNFANKFQAVQNLRPMIEQGIARGRDFIGQGEAVMRGAQEHISMENTETTLKEMLNVLISMRDGERMQLQFERAV